MLQVGLCGNLQLSICYLLLPGCIMLIKPLPVQHSVEAQEERTGLCQYKSGSSNTGMDVFWVCFVCLFFICLFDFCWGEAHTQKKINWLLYLQMKP